MTIATVVNLVRSQVYHTERPPLFAACLICGDVARREVFPATTDTCSFWATVTSNCSPHATGPMSCLSVTLMYCGQKIGWIKMPLGTVGTEVGLGPGDIVLDIGTQLPSPLKGA